MRRRWSIARAFFLFYAGLFWLVVQAYPLVLEPARRTPSALLWLALPLASIYVGVRFNEIVAKTPKVIYYLLYIAVALTAVGVGIALVQGPPPPLAGVPQPSALVYYASVVGFGAVAILIWAVLLKSVRRHAAFASELEPE